jgi:hypothetical protein
MPIPNHPDAPINPTTLMLAPELAILAVMEEVATIARFALIAAHPRLADPEPPGPEPPAVVAAHQLIERLHACRLACARYRRTTLRELLDSDRHDDTIPF